MAVPTLWSKATKPGSSETGYQKAGAGHGHTVQVVRKGDPLGGIFVDRDHHNEEWQWPWCLCNGCCLWLNMPPSPQAIFFPSQGVVYNGFWPFSQSWWCWMEPSQQVTETSLQKQGLWERQEVMMSLPAVPLKFTAQAKRKSIQFGETACLSSLRWVRALLNLKIMRICSGKWFSFHLHASKIWLAYTGEEPW